jgi:type VI secretion system secreted protein VgrG
MLPTDREPVTIDGTSVPLHLHWMTGHEELGRLFEYELELYCEKLDVKFDAILGKPLTVCVTKFEGVRFYNGIVTRLWRVGVADRYLVLRATLSPKLWLLGRTSDCRVYQKKTVPKVIEEVFKEHSITFTPKRLNADNYKEWDYLTQYRESDFAFVSRLMEREGIYYYFKHTKTDHELVLSDSISCHDSVKGYDPVEVRPPSHLLSDRDHLSQWRIGHRVTSLGSTLQAHDFRLRRGADIKAVQGVPPEHPHDEFQLYDYAGHYVGSQNAESTDAPTQRGAGEHYAKVILDEQRTELEQVDGEGTLCGLEVGALFKIDDLDAPKDSLLVVSTQHEVRNPKLVSGSDGDGPSGPICRMSFIAINSTRQFRAARVTERALALGPETATVVGPSGEEISTDPYGRVRIQFHWDREGKSNESSSCWVRVAQMWAGSNWGSIYIPRIGHEVVVQFLGGDPDRPIITGSVYNANNMPPYKLPTNATQSGIKSRSSKGGSPSNFNEIRFEDKKGSEQLYIQAEKNQDNMVKADATLTVGGDRTKTITKNETTKVGINRTETVGADEKVTIGANQTLTVTANQTISVGANRSMSIGANQTETVAVASAETVGAAKALTIGAAYQVSVGAAMNETIGGLKAEEIGGAKTVMVGALSSEKVAGNKSVTAGGNISETASGNVSISAGKNGSVTAGDNFSASAGKKAGISAGDQLSLSCGSATIVLKKNGDIVINGKKISIKGSGEVVVQGSKINQNG